MGLTKERMKALGLMPKKDGPAVLIWDIETSPIICAVFQLKTDYISHKNIIQDWFMFCAAWKWLGEDKIYNVSLLDDMEAFEKDHTNDSIVVDILHQVLSNADVIVAHNGDKFDLKMFNVRAMKNELEPLPYIPSVDTLAEAKKYFRFTSNRLDYLGQYLGFGNKADTEEGLWLKCLRGDIKSLKKMIYYNKRDVELLEKVYLKLRGHMRTHPNLNLVDGNKHMCPRCAPENTIMQKRGFYRTRVSVFQRYQCQSCKGWSRSKKSIKVTDIR